MVATTTKFFKYSNQSSHSLAKTKQNKKSTDISEPVAYKIISSLRSHSQQVTKPENSSPSLLNHSSRRVLLQKGRFPKNPCDFLNELYSNNFDHKPRIVLSNVNNKYKLEFLKSKIFYLWATGLKHIKQKSVKSEIYFKTQKCDCLSQIQTPLSMLYQQMIRLLYAFA